MAILPRKGLWLCSCMVEEGDGGDPGKVTLGFVPVSVEVSTSMISKNKGLQLDA